MSQNTRLFKKFRYGAAVYPEFINRDEWLRLLDDMLGMRMNTVRLLESAWGWLEPGPAERRHGEAVRWLDDAQERGMHCILGTGSFLPPQWLFARHPDALVHTRAGEIAHPLARKSVCLEHPGYLDHLHAHLAACAAHWGQHPSVVAWQLDNEIDRINVDWACYCPRCEAAWTQWLCERYRSVENLNTRLRLDHWGLEISAIGDLPLPRVITEVGRHPGLAALEARFRRDRVTAFLREQAVLLRAHGVTQPFSHNFLMRPDFTAEEPGQEPFLNFGAHDLYLDWSNSEDSTVQLHQVRLMEQHRTAHDGDFMLMETSTGTVGSQAMVTPCATAETIRRRIMLAVGAGAKGVMFWSGNCWRGGPWIFHGSLHDFTGHLAPEHETLRAFGKFLEAQGSALLQTPVCHDVAVISSQAANAIAFTYSVFPDSGQLGRRFEGVCRQRGLAVDILTPRQAACPETLARYRMVALFGEAQGLGQPEVVAALAAYARAGGTVVVGPLAAYVNEEGAVPQDGLGAALVELTGVAVPIFRWFGEGVIEVEAEGSAVPAMAGFVESATACHAGSRARGDWRCFRQGSTASASRRLQRRQTLLR